MTTALRRRRLRDLGLHARDVQVFLTVLRLSHPRNGGRLQRLIRTPGWHRKVALDRQLSPGEPWRLRDALRSGVISGTPGVLVRLAMVSTSDLWLRGAVHSLPPGGRRAPGRGALPVRRPVLDDPRGAGP